jgi:tetratricopeptide (TPR) repeat protein
MPPHRRNPAIQRSRARPDRQAPLFSDDDGDSARPNRVLVGMIAVLCIAMTAGVITMWRAGLWEPGQVIGSTFSVQAGPAPQAEVITAALESARSYMIQGEWGKAEAILSQAAERYPIEQELRVALGETYLAQRRHVDAYEQYAKALAIGPRDHKLEFTAGQVASTAGLRENAVDHYALAQRGDPFNAMYPLMQGMVERQLGRHDAAKTSLLRAANLDPQNAFAWGTLADISLSENNVNLAVQHITRARQLQPESREWRLIEARARKRRGEPETALMLLMTLEASQKTEPSVIRLTAECFGMLNRHADAAATWAAGFQAHPGDGAMAFEAALAYERAGNRARAVELARHAQGLGHPGAPRLLERLRG